MDLVSPHLVYAGHLRSHGSPWRSARGRVVHSVELQVDLRKQVWHRGDDRSVPSCIPVELHERHGQQLHVFGHSKSTLFWQLHQVDFPLLFRFRDVRWYIRVHFLLKVRSPPSPKTQLNVPLHTSVFLFWSQFTIQFPGQSFCFFFSCSQPSAWQQEVVGACLQQQHVWMSMCVTQQHCFCTPSHSFFLVPLFQPGHPFCQCSPFALPGFFLAKRVQLQGLHRHVGRRGHSIHPLFVRRVFQQRRIVLQRFHALADCLSCEAAAATKRRSGLAPKFDVKFTTKGTWPGWWSEKELYQAWTMDACER
mmetsp:Transcript_1798/g.11005  ORF Transcript_1798/g.11005 Transcript_1798/m.11005 type:complete len:306 (-) Transcript_1798:1534-2451(-)